MSHTFSSQADILRHSEPQACIQEVVQVVAGVCVCAVSLKLHKAALERPQCRRKPKKICCVSVQERLYRCPRENGTICPFGALFLRRVKLTPDPDTFEKYRDTPPISFVMLLKRMPPSWQKVVYTPEICITMRLPFVSRSFCRSIRVRVAFEHSHFPVFICSLGAFAGQSLG